MQQGDVAPVMAFGDWVSNAKLCQLEGCGTPLTGLQTKWCSPLHQQKGARYVRKGSPKPTGRQSKDPVDNWLSKIEIGTWDECWLWQAGLDKDGYGKFAVGLEGGGQQHLRAHRFAYEMFVADITEDRPYVLHSCDTPSCANPGHLWAGDAKDNAQDCVRKGRHGPVSKVTG